MTSPNSRSQDVLRVVPGLVLMVAVALGGAFALWKHHTEYSKLDANYLAEFEAPSSQSVRDGSFMATFDEYMDDRLPGRDTLLAAHAGFTATVLRDPVTDDVFRDGPGGQLLERPPTLSVPSTLAADATSLARAMGDAPVLWVYAPRKEEVFADAVPAAWPNSYTSLHRELVAALEPSGDVLDLTDMMRAEREAGTAFFRTDHHWTPTAARDAADAAADRLASLGVTVGPGPTEYVQQTEPHPFIGSTGRRVTIGAVAGDVFTYPAPAGGFAATMCVEEDCGLPTFDAAVASDPGLYQNRYVAFIGGDNGIVTITNSSPTAKGRVLLIKDSYGNAFATYLAERVAELIVVDERHYEGPPLNVLAATVNPDAVIVLHNPLSLLGSGFDFSSWTTTGDVEHQVFATAPAAQAVSALAVPGVFGSTVIVNTAGLALTVGPDQPLDPTLGDDAKALARAIDATGAAQVWVYAPRKEEAFADQVPAGLENPVDAKRATVLGYLGAAHPVIDLTPQLADPDLRDDYYFRTDHHWTSAAAAIATERILGALEEQGVTLGPDDRTWSVVTGPKRFLGSDAKELPASAVLPAETFWYLAPEGGFRSRLCVEDSCATDVIYARALADPDPLTNRYKAFLNGGFAPQHLHNADPSAQGTLVILKDSYAHPVALALAERARDVYLVDERGWEGEPLGQFIDSVDADAVVVLHNQVSLLSQAFNSEAWRNAGQ